MNDITISLPDASLRAYVEQVVAGGDYRSASDYVATLINEDRKRRAKARLEALLLEGLEGEPQVLTKEDWDQMRREYDARHPAADEYRHSAASVDRAT
jgi:antitoxin ParD1/3/4